MAGEPGSRFAHFLQPIRDLSKVWKIEIAEELEKYIDELAQVSIDNPEDGAKMNFPEAALLIQGSTAIYSRKVELLYQLVYQALDLISSDKAGGASKKGKAAQSGLWAPIPDTDELLTIDHLIKEGRNIVLDSNAPEQRQAMQRRVPLFLMPRNKEDRQKQEFRIQGCTVHHTGAYLLQESDSRLLDDLLASDDSMRRNCPDEPLVPAPPSTVQDLDRQLQALLHEIPEEKSEELVAMNSPAKTPAKTPLASTPNPMSAGRTPMQGMSAQMNAELARRQLAPAGDPWALQDEHETIGQDAPLEVGKTSKRVVAAKKLLMNAEGLPDPLSQEPLQDGQLWGNDATAGVAAMATAGDPVESLFLTVAGQLKPGGRYETQRAHFSPAWLEFEDLFSAAHSKWRQLRIATKAPERKGAEEEEEETPGRKKAQDSENEESDDENPAVGTPAKFVPGTPAKTPAGATPSKQLAISDEQEENRKEVARLESMIADAQQQYEATVRHHLQKMQKDSLDGDSKKFPQLYANVRRWQDQLEPVLREFESRPDFHIHEYSLHIIDKLVKEKEAGHSPILFEKLVEGVPRYEVCRRFLTTLFLTNQGNLDIHFESEAERINGFGVSVLKADKEWISFDEEAAPVQDGETVSKKSGRAKKDAEQPASAELAKAGKAGKAKKAKPAEEKEEEELEIAEEPLHKKRRSNAAQKVPAAAEGGRRTKAGA